MSRKKSKGELKKPDFNKVITVGLPLPEVLEYSADVSMSTRQCLENAYNYMRSRGFHIHELSEKGINVADNHNRLAQRMIGDWLLICGSDHTFAPNAMELLWKAAQEEPQPKIIGAIIPHRHEPYAYVCMSEFDEETERVSSLKPFTDFHPGHTMAGVGAVRSVGTIGSGFCLYHRSVFDTVPYPWFLFAKRQIPLPEAEKILRDFNGNRNFPEFLEQLANGDRFIDDHEKGLLKEKATQLRRALARVRAPFAYGPDYHINMAAKDYGIKTYVHLGVTVFHLAFVPIHLGHYVAYLQGDQSNWWSSLMGSKPATTQNIQEVRKLVEQYDYQRHMDAPELMADFEKKYGSGNGGSPAEDVVAEIEEVDVVEEVAV